MKPPRVLALLAGVWLGQAACGPQGRTDSPSRMEADPAGTGGSPAPTASPGETEGCCRMTQRGGQSGMGGGMTGGGADEGMGGQMGPGMMSQGMGHEMMRDMRPIHGLLAQHEKVRREVEDIPGGVRTVTTSEDAQVAQLIRTHVAQMKERLEKGEPIRPMDPLFRELFEHHESIHMHVEDVPGGVRVTETAEDPQVVLLIRQHARRAVSEFVEQGMPRAMRPTPLPEGYREKGAALFSAESERREASAAARVPP